MRFALLLLVSLTVWWIEGPVFRSPSSAPLAAFIVWHDAGWALGALVALACIASLAGWLDRFHEWFLERVDGFAAN